MLDRQKLRIIFMGTSAFAEQILASLILEKYNVISAYTQSDKKVGRDQKLEKSPVKILAEKSGIQVFTPHKLSEDIAEEIKNQKPDMIIVAAYGKIIPKAILDLPQFGAINIHASLLPKYRGASPIQNAIFSGETETGATIMLMDEGVDTGDILSQATVAIEQDETAPKLSKKIADASLKLLVETIPQWISGKIIAQKQDGSQATFCKMIDRKDGKIDWNDKAITIYNRFRAFHPWPGIFAFWEHNGKNLRIKLKNINFFANNPDLQMPIGSVFKSDSKIGVQTSEGIVILEEVQLEGKPSTNIQSFLNGYPDFIGSILK